MRTLWESALVSTIRDDSRGTWSSGSARRRVRAVCCTAVVALAAAWVSSAGATSIGGLHVPTATNFCGGETVVVELTACNDGGSTVVYDVSFAPSGGVVYDCEEDLQPSHTFLDPPVFSLAPGECRTVRVRVDRPSELDTYSSVCYWVVFDSDPGGVSWLGATLRDQPLTCIDWYFEEAATFIHPLDPVTYEFEIFNYGNEPVELLYLWEVWGEDGVPDTEVISLNGMEPGAVLFDEIFVPEGESQVHSVDVEWLDEGRYGFFDLVVVREDNFAPIASIGIGRVQEVAADVDEGSSGAELDRVQVSASPNPFRESSAVRFSLPREMAHATASVVDASGRRVRTLFSGRALAAGESRVDWDGRDDQGRDVPAGAYWIRLAGAETESSARVVRTR